MKKLFILILLTCVSISKTNSQIGYSSNPFKNAKNINPDLYNKFRNSTTIFILSELYDIKTYESIIKDSWKITPYKIITRDELNYKNYLNKNYSFINLYGLKLGHFMFFGIRLHIPNQEKIQNKIRKLNNKSKDINYAGMFNIYSDDIACFHLYMKNNFINSLPYYEYGDALEKAKQKTMEKMYTKEVYKSYNPGLLKNHFQKLSQLLKSNKAYWIYSDEENQELAKLSSQELILPSYLDLKFDISKGMDVKKINEYSNDLLKKYNFEYSIETLTDVSNRIMNNEEFYYLRYTLSGTDRFIQIVNSKNGEVIYRKYSPLGDELKPKHFKAISKAIKKAAKRKNK